MPFPQELVQKYVTTNHSKLPGKTPNNHNHSLWLSHSLLVCGLESSWSLLMLIPFDQKCKTGVFGYLFKKTQCIGKKRSLEILRIKYLVDVYAMSESLYKNQKIRVYFLFEWKCVSFSPSRSTWPNHKQTRSVRFLFFFSSSRFKEVF